jgi:hypothetical protein
LSVQVALTHTGSAGAETLTVEVAAASHQFDLVVTFTFADSVVPSLTVHTTFTWSGDPTEEGSPPDMALSLSAPTIVAPTRSPALEPRDESNPDAPCNDRGWPGSAAARGAAPNSAKAPAETTETTAARSPVDDRRGSGPSSPAQPANLTNGIEAAPGPAVANEDLAPEQQSYQKELAVGLRWLHPDWTDTVIARIVGVSRRTLFRWREYVAAKEVQKEAWRPPRGNKTRDGGLEARMDEEG